MCINIFYLNVTVFITGFFVHWRIFRQTITVTGPKNAQLICIRDDDSFVEAPLNKGTQTSVSDNNICNNSSGKAVNNIKNHFQSESDLSKLCQKGNQLATKTRLLNLRQLNVLPKEALESLMSYKSEFNKFAKQHQQPVQAAER